MVNANAIQGDLRIEASPSGSGVDLVIAARADVRSVSVDAWMGRVRAAGVELDELAEECIRAFIGSPPNECERRLTLAPHGTPSPVGEHTTLAMEQFDEVRGVVRSGGDMCVRTRVEPGSRIVAGGSLVVHAGMEAAIVEVAGDVTCAGGVFGRGSGAIRAGGCVASKCLDAVTVEAGRDVTVLKEAINCELSICGNMNAPDGAIIGGVCSVVGTVTIRSLGSPAGVPTRLVLGSVPRLESLHKALTSIADSLEAYRAREANELAQLNIPGRRLTAKDRERQTELEFLIHTNQSRLNKCATAGLHCSECIKTLKTVRLFVEERLHAGVALVVGGQEFVFGRDVDGPIRITRSERGEVCFQREIGDEPIGLSLVGGVRTRAARDSA